MNVMDTVSTSDVQTVERVTHVVCHHSISISTMMTMIFLILN